MEGVWEFPMWVLADPRNQLCVLNPAPLFSPVIINAFICIQISHVVQLMSLPVRRDVVTSDPRVLGSIIYQVNGDITEQQVITAGIFSFSPPCNDLIVLHLNSWPL